VELSATPLIFQDKPAVQLIAHDITERRQIEEALRRSESRKGAILETALDAIIFFNHRCLIQEWNAAAQKVFGYSRQQALGKDMAELIIPPELRQAHRDAWERYLATGEGHMVGERFEIVAQRAGGSQFPAELSIVRVQGATRLYSRVSCATSPSASRPMTPWRGEARKRVIWRRRWTRFSIDRKGRSGMEPSGRKIFGYRRSSAQSPVGWVDHPGGFWNDTRMGWPIVDDRSGQPVGTADRTEPAPR
jgi:PAS domain S-box-containing protein